MLKVDRSKLLDMYHYATLSTPISNKKIYIITILENCNRNQSSSACLKCDFDLLYLLQKQDCQVNWIQNIIKSNSSLNLLNLQLNHPRILNLISGTSFKSQNVTSTKTDFLAMMPKYFKMGNVFHHIISDTSFFTWKTRPIPYPWRVPTIFMPYLGILAF